MSLSAQASLYKHLLEPLIVSEQASVWCANSTQLSLALQSCLRNHQRLYSFSQLDLGIVQAKPLRTEKTWSETYKRQSRCPADFAWLDLHALPVPDSGVLFDIAFDRVLAEWGGTAQTIADDRELLLFLPAVFKGLIEGLRSQALTGVYLKLTGIRIHPVDSRPGSFYLCGFQAIRRLAEENTRRV